MSVKDLDKEQIEKLVRLAQEGDTEAFGKIYDFYADSIFRYLLFKVGNENAMDLTENLFLKVWENLKSYRTGNLYFSSWIFKIAHNLVIDFYRLNKQTIPLTIDIPDEKEHRDPVFIAEKSLSNKVLAKAISKLKKNYREVILLKYINELDNREVAGILRRGEGSLRILKFRALKALKRILEEMGVHY
jgi:RNA polymerase sigma-70 factor (ECF subfamily)